MSLGNDVAAQENRPGDVWAVSIIRWRVWVRDVIQAGRCWCRHDAAGALCR
jgi:hypothetical protein